MASVEKGSVVKLMILETLPKPINFTGGMDPLSYVGTFTLPPDSKWIFAMWL